MGKRTRWNSKINVVSVMKLISQKNCFTFFHVCSWKNRSWKETNIKILNASKRRVCKLQTCGLQAKNLQVVSCKSTYLRIACCHQPVCKLQSMSQSSVCEFQVSRHVSSPHMRQNQSNTANLTCSNPV